MKKVFILFIVANFLVSNAVCAAYLQPPTVGNGNFYPLMQHQMEKEETLDFVNHPEEYKQKREEKDARLDYIEGKTDVNPYFKKSIKYNTKSIPVNMEFTNDGSGQLKIQEIK